MGWLDVLVADALGLLLDAHLHRLTRGLDLLHVGPVLRIHQALVVLHRELGIDRQPDRRALVLARQLDGKLHEVAATWYGANVFGVLVWCQDLLDDGTKLHLAPRAARLDVGQNALKVTHTGGQGLHLAQPTMHLLQSLRDLLERLAQALLQCGVELLVHGLAHLL